jgi:hypothetical protein
MDAFICDKFPDLGLKFNPDFDEFSWFGVGASSNQKAINDSIDSNKKIFNSVGLSLNLDNFILKLWKENDLKVKSKNWFSVSEFDFDWNQKNERKDIFPCGHNFDWACLNCKMKKAYMTGLLGRDFTHDKIFYQDVYLVYLAGLDYRLEELNDPSLDLK